MGLGRRSWLRRPWAQRARALGGVCPWGTELALLAARTEEAPMLLRVLRYTVLLLVLTARERLARAVKRP